MTIRIGIVGEGDVEFVPERDQTGHCVGRRTIHANFAVMIDGHETEGGIDGGVHDGRVDTIAFDHRLPVVDGGTAQRIDADAHTGGADRLHRHHIFKVGDIGRDVIMRVRGGGFVRARIGDAFDTGQIFGQQLVCGLADPAGDIGIRRAAMGRIVFEAAFIGRIVRRADHDAVRQPGIAAVIIGEDGVADDGRRGIAVGRIDHGFDAVGGEHFQHTGESRFG